MMNKLKFIRNSYFLLKSNRKYSTSTYDVEYKKSLNEPEKYWQSKIDLIEWFEKPKFILDKSNSPYEKW